MIKSSRLLAALLAICLLLPLTGWAAAAQTPEKGRDPEEWAAQLLPKLVGSWVGYQGNDTVQFTWYPDGRYELVFFNITSSTANLYAGRFSELLKTEPADVEVTFEGDLFTRKYSFGSSTLRRMKAPYVRLSDEEETACVPAVPELIGTFGGRLDGVYVEWTFHADGYFTQVTPTEELTEKGQYVAGVDDLAILLNGKIIKFPYSVRPTINMIIHPSEDVKVVLVKKAGPLVQLPAK
ncbi:MAG: hypothetical protein AB9880_12250 [Christensenellales bacterium]